MGAKAGILERIGERSLLLPELINEALAANDRVKYYLTLFQAAYGYAQAPGTRAPDLRNDRECAGVSDESLDRIVGASHMVTPATVYVPGAAAIVDHIFGDVRQMLEPVVTSAAMHGELTERSAVYTRRLDDQIAHTPACPDDQIAVSAIEALTSVSGNGHDTLHQLVMDLHWELNRLQASVSVELLDGAHVYGLADVDRHLVRAFMKGIHETASLKFQHPGLETTATRDGDHLLIQNDLGVTDAHVIVIHVRGLQVRVIYTDVHRARARFIRDLLEPYDINWTHGGDTPGFEISTGTHTAADDSALERFLTTLGSRLVFLIDWNRARKRLGRFVRKSDAIALLTWAAHNNVGHEAFLQAGDLRLIHTALERVQSPSIQYGARLDEILGRDAANRFLMSVLRITQAALSRRCSPRLLDDEIEAELLMYLQRSDRSLLAAVSDHAMILAGMIDGIRRAVAQLKASRVQSDTATTAALLKASKVDADAIVRKAKRSVDNVDHAAHLRRLLAQGDRAVKLLEDAGFVLTLVPPGIDAAVADLLDQFTDLCSRAAREYVRCLEDARDLSRNPARPQLERFLVTVDRLAALEDSCDEAERAVRERVFRGAVSDFREAYALSELTRQLDRATDSVVESGLLVRDYVLSLAPGA